MEADRLSVAVVGARFGSLDIEAEELVPLNVELRQGAGTTAAEIVQVAKTARAILAGSGPRFNREVLGQLPACRAIVRYGVGTETIDIQAATELRIMIANVPDYCAEEVSTHTLALILASVRKLLPAHRAASAGEWQLARVRPLFSTENLVLGLVGFGRIGQAVARKAKPFGFQILVFDPYKSRQSLIDEGLVPTELDDLFARADVISLHSPETEETHHMIDAAALSRMKPTAFLVNCSRGGLIDESALEEALKQGKLAGAALDVMENEPVTADRALLKSERVLITPHLAWYTEQSTERMRRYASREVARVLRGERPRNLVNPTVFVDSV